MGGNAGFGGKIAFVKIFQDISIEIKINIVRIQGLRHYGAFKL